LAPLLRIDEVTAFLYALKPRGIRFGLENTRLVLEALGRPQDNFSVAHLAGSNGKGSTAAFLDRILRAHGLRVGLYTSPHLVNFRERFRVDGQPVSDERICDQMESFLRDGLDLVPEEVSAFVRGEGLVERMTPDRWYAERGASSRFSRLTFFECTTILAAMIFADLGVDVAIMETGMGGRLDATNVFEPKVCGITSIDLEHTAWLGEDLATIAGEKAGIIKQGVPVICAPQRAEALSVIEDEAEKRNAPFSLVGKDIQIKGSWSDADFLLANMHIKGLRLGLAGPHQIHNAAVALGCADALISLRPEASRLGLESVKWPGRFEQLGPGGRWVLDGAHNPGGCRVLASTWRQIHGDLKPCIVFGVLGDKQLEPMLTALSGLADDWWLVPSRDARGRAPEEYSNLIPSARLASSVGNALDAWWSSGAGPLLVCGSLGVVGEAKLWFGNKEISSPEAGGFQIKLN